MILAHLIDWWVKSEFSWLKNLTSMILVSKHALRIEEKKHNSTKK